MIRLTLPYPPTANLYWRKFRGRIVKSNDARKYQVAVKLLARAQSKAKPFSGPVRVTLDVYRPRKIGDLDNTLKVLLDALKGVAFADDSQVVSISAERMDDKAHPRVFVVVRPANVLATVEASP